MQTSAVDEPTLDLTRQATIYCFNEMFLTKLVSNSVAFNEVPWSKESVNVETLQAISGQAIDWDEYSWYR